MLGVSSAGGGTFPSAPSLALQLHWEWLTLDGGRWVLKAGRGGSGGAEIALVVACTLTRGNRAAGVARVGV